MDRKEMKKRFIKRLAEYFGGTNQVEKSCYLQMGDKQAKEWAELRSLTPLFGYPSVEEAEKELTEFLG